MKKTFFCFCFFFLFSIAWAFGELTQQLEITLQEQGYNKNSTNLSLLFDNQSTKKNINNIKLKKTISKKLLENFRVVDPIFTQDFVNQKNWGKKDFLNKKNRLYFFQQTDSQVLVYTELYEKQGKIFALHTIFQAQTDEIVKVHQSFQKEPFLKNKTSAKKEPFLKNKTSAKKEQNEQLLFASSSNNFFSQNSLEDIIPNNIQDPQDEFLTEVFSTPRKGTNWIVYQPTAFFVPKHTIYQRFSVESVEFVEVTPNLFRYSYGYANFEFSANVLGEGNTVDHSYLRVKTLLYNQGGITPIFTLAGGLRTRLYRKNNEEQPEEDQAREDLSFFLSFSGYPRTYFLYNFYLDNYSAGLGGKLFLENNIHFFVDSRYDYQHIEQKQYSSLGIELFPSNVGFAFSFSSIRNNSEKEGEIAPEENANNDNEEKSNFNMSIIFNF